MNKMTIYMKRRRRNLVESYLLIRRLLASLLLTNDAFSIAITLMYLSFDELLFSYLHIQFVVHI